MASRIVPPSAAALIASLRGVGYSLETAIADLVDNSIAAGALSIDVQFDWNSGQPVASITDDGRGMDESTLIEAMRFGGTGPHQVRSDDDLGRFGLGLKTASLSQCRRLQVTSRTQQGAVSFIWDIDHIRTHGEKWTLIEAGAADRDRALSILGDRRAGTVVEWQNLDFGRQEDQPDHAAFMRSLEQLERHLGMVFHRFLNGDARRLTISLNGRRVLGWDPFLEDNEATRRTPEQQLKGPGGTVRVRGFVLPHRDRFATEDAFNAAGGPDGWTSQQGFYIYRGKRLLSWGGWLGLGGSRAWTREEPSRLARIRIDIPNSADREWRIDIRKAIARIPDGFRKPLGRLAEDVRRRAREVFVHRGQYGARPRSAEVSRIWLVAPEGARRRYTIERQHDLVALVRDKLPASSRELLGALLDHIERTVPVDRVWLDVTENGVPPVDEAQDELIREAADMMRLIEKAGISRKEAAGRVAAMDPFDQIEGLADILLGTKGSKR